MYTLITYVFLLKQDSEKRPWCRDKPLSCKPGAACLIPGFSIKPLSVSLWVFPVLKQDSESMMVKFDGN